MTRSAANEDSIPSTEENIQITIRDVSTTTPDSQTAPLRPPTFSERRRYEASEVDAVLSSYGLCRRFYPIGVYLLYLPVIAFFSWQMFVLSFAAWVPPSLCGDGGGNATVGGYRNNVSSIEEGNKTWNETGEEKGDRNITACRWKSEVTPQQSLAVEWNLIGSDADLINTTNSCFMFGMLLANLFLGGLSDLLGRKLMIFGSMALLGLLSVISSVVQTIVQMMILRFFIGIFYCTGCFTAFTFLPELFPSRYRLIPSQCVIGLWSVGMCSLSLVAFLVDDWRNLHLFIGLSSLFFVPIYFLSPESIVWLAAKRRYSELEETDRRIQDGRIWMKRLPSLTRTKESQENIEMKELGSCGDEEKKVNWKCGDLNLIFVANLFIVTFYWFVDGLIYFALQFTTSQFSGDRFLNFFLFGIVEIPALLIAALLNKFTTRRFALFTLHASAGISMIVLASIRLLFPSVLSNFPAIVFCLNLFVKFCVSGSFSILALVAVEVFPTPVRVFAYNLSGAGSRVSGIAAMFLPILVRRMQTPVALELTFGILGILAAFSTIWLVESKGHPVPQTMEDLKDMKKGTRSIFKIRP